MDQNLVTTHALSSITAAVVGAAQYGVGRLLGADAERTVCGTLTWEDVGTLLFFALLAGLIQALLALLLRRKTKAAVDEIHGHYIRALGGPIYLLVWIYAFYLATASLLSQFGSNEGLTFAYEGFDKFLDLGVFCVLLWLFFRLTRVLEMRLMAWAAKTPGKLDDLFVPLLGKSLRTLMPVVGVIFALPLLQLPAEYAGILQKGTSILLITAVALVLCQLVNLGEKTVLAEFDIRAADNLRARKIYTQVHVISKTLYVFIILFAAASVLMLFDSVRHFGASILASAGVVGVIIGFAAQKMLSNLFAGFQLAMTQPIRLDDVVIVEGEWGRIEEITLTYVVVHIWDDRRLVVPLSYFIEKPFQNWTRTSAGLLGSVFVWADYTLPVDEIRGALKEMIEKHPLWDKRFWNLQVTDATENTMQIRVLATAENSDKSWDLRCDIREKLIAHIQKHYPQSLPRVRASLFPVPGAPGAPSI